MLSRIQSLISDRIDYSLDLSTDTNIGYITDSLQNDLVPFYNIFVCKYKKIKNLSYSEYYLPSPTSIVRTTNKLIYFKTAIANLAKPIKFLKGDKSYFIAKHLIYVLNEGNPEVLYTLAVRKSYLFGGEMRLSNLDYSKFVILISNKLLTTENRPMLNILKKEVIEPLAQEGIDVMYTNDIMRTCYKSPLEPYTFTNLSERRVFLNSINNTVFDGLTRTEQNRTGSS